MTRLWVIADGKVRDLGKIDPVGFDTVVVGLLSSDPHDIEYLGMVSETLNAWDENAVRGAIEIYSQAFAN